MGLNSLVWGGTNESGAIVPPGVYTVSIAAASTGYDTWTNITDDGTNFDAVGLTSIDVNRNTNSAYYGRVVRGVRRTGSLRSMKRNADGSPGDEGGYSNGGLPWGAAAGGVDAFFSPWKIAIGANDKVYINDFSGFGVVYCVRRNHLDELPGSVDSDQLSASVGSPTERPLRDRTRNQ